MTVIKNFFVSLIAWAIDKFYCAQFFTKNNEHWQFTAITDWLMATKKFSFCRFELLLFRGRVKTPIIIKENYKLLNCLSDRLFFLFVNIRCVNIRMKYRVHSSLLVWPTLFRFLVIFSHLKLEWNNLFSLFSLKFNFF